MLRGEQPVFIIKICDEKHANTDKVNRYGNYHVSVHDQILDLAVGGVNSESIKEIVIISIK